MTESGMVVTYTKAVAKWIAKGRPTRSEAQIAELLQICTSCPSYDAENHKCKECGCNLSDSVSPLTNKLAMATEDCPLGKWPKMEGGNIIILGVGHSGTSILTQMLGTLGFHTGPGPFYEHDELVSINEGLLGRENRAVLRHKATNWLRNLPQPWVIKDPRFTITLSWWTKLFEVPPMMLYLTRDQGKLAESYVRRNEVSSTNIPGAFGRSVKDLCSLAHAKFKQYPGPKIRIDFDRLTDAIKLFDVERP